MFRELEELYESKNYKKHHILQFTFCGKVKQKNQLKDKKMKKLAIDGRYNEEQMLAVQKAINVI